jgi:hypothetical protein
VTLGVALAVGVLVSTTLLVCVADTDGVVNCDCDGVLLEVIDWLADCSCVPDPERVDVTLPVDAPDALDVRELELEKLGVRVCVAVLVKLELGVDVSVASCDAVTAGLDDILGVRLAMGEEVSATLLACDADTDGVAN